MPGETSHDFLFAWDLRHPSSVMLRTIPPASGRKIASLYFPVFARVHSRVTYRCTMRSRIVTVKSRFIVSASG